MQQTKPMEASTRVSWKIILPLLLLIGWGAIVAFITTLPNSNTSFRLSLRYEQSVYIIALASYAMYFVYLYLKGFPSLGAGPTRVINQVIEYVLVGTVLGMYVSGASIATPGFLSFLGSAFNSVPFPLELHTFIAPAVAVMAIVAAFFVGRDLIHGQRNLTRYILVAMIVLIVSQGVTGSILFGTISPAGPFGLISWISSGSDVFLRTVHDLGSALLAALTVGYLYFAFLGWALKKNPVKVAASPQ